MTVETLIQLLQKLEPTLEVFVGDRDYGPQPIEPYNVVPTMQIELGRVVVL